MQNKIVIVTGGSAGPGRAAAEMLAGSGARVVTLSRLSNRGLEAFEDLQRIGSSKVDWIPTDLSSRKSVEDFVKLFQSKYHKVDCLIHCAEASPAGERELTTDRLEAVFATNYLSCFMLAHRLCSSLQKGGQARVITLTPVQPKGQAVEWLQGRDIDFENLQGEKHYSPGRASRQAALAGVLLIFELSRRWAAEGISACALFSGQIAGRQGGGAAGFTAKLQSALGKALTYESFASQLMELAEGRSSDKINGKLFAATAKGLKEIYGADQPYGEEIARRLWETSERLINEKP